MTLKITSFKKSSLKRKDSLWIYKHPQGLQLLDDVSFGQTHIYIHDAYAIMIRN